MKLIFVCTGNTCRSPMAEGFLKKFLHDSGNHSIEVISRGIAAQEGETASSHSVTAALDFGVDISHHVSRQLTEEDITDANLVLTMTQAHASVIKSVFPSQAHKVFSIGEYADCGDISDPYGGDLSLYRACAKELFDAADKINSKISGKQ